MCHAAGRFNSGPSRQRMLPDCVALHAEEPQFSLLFLHKGPAEDQPPEMRDGLRISGLVMSINNLHIFLLYDDGRGRGPGRVQTPPR